MEREGIVYGYARVSAKDQKLRRQIDALTGFPVAEERIYADTASGTDFERPEYRKLVKRRCDGGVEEGLEQKAAPSIPAGGGSTCNKLPLARYSATSTSVISNVKSWPASSWFVSNVAMPSSMERTGKGWPRWPIM